MKWQKVGILMLFAVVLELVAESDAAQALLLLQSLKIGREKWREKIQESAQAPTSSDEESAEKASNLSKFYEIDESNSLKKMMSFWREKFKEFYRLVKLPLQQKRNCRGPQYEDTSIDVIFMLLCVLKNGETWHYNVAMFRKKTLHLKSVSRPQLMKFLILLKLNDGRTWRKIFHDLDGQYTVLQSLPVHTLRSWCTL